MISEADKNDQCVDPSAVTTETTAVLKPSQFPKNNLPIVSIIMPIRNEEEHIAKSLGSVLNQDYPNELLDVLVADGRSSDQTSDIVRQLAGEHSQVNVIMLDNPRRIVPAALNAALKRARGEVIIRVDGHTFIASDYVSQCIEALKRTGADNAGGPMRPVGLGWFGETVALATTSRFGIGGARFHYSDREEFVDTVYLGAWRRSVFERIGFFDEEQVRNQDDEFNYRLRSNGGKILLSPRIKSHYYNRSTPRSLWCQYFQYGYWKVRVMQKHPAQMSPRHFAPPLLVATLLCSLLAAPFYQPAAYVFGLLSGTYLFANLSATLIVARRLRRRCVIVLPMVFAILHFSYGMGFLVGLIMFWHRWGRHARNEPVGRTVQSHERALG
jgi:glycosyltransferase involved in cell wall biosynthesis